MSRPFAVAAILYGFVGRCKRLGADPFAYLKDVLGRLPTHPGDRLAELLPDAWFTAHSNTRRKATSGRADPGAPGLDSARVWR